jgi:hypothetical protein
MTRSHSGVGLGDRWLIDNRLLFINVRKFVSLALSEFGITASLSFAIRHQLFGTASRYHATRPTD